MVHSIGVAEIATGPPVCQLDHFRLRPIDDGQNLAVRGERRRTTPRQFEEFLTVLKLSDVNPSSLVTEQSDQTTVVREHLRLGENAGKL